VLKPHEIEVKDQVEEALRLVGIYGVEIIVLNWLSETHNYSKERAVEFAHTIFLKAGEEHLDKSRV